MSQVHWLPVNRMSMTQKTQIMLKYRLNRAFTILERTLQARWKSLPPNQLADPFITGFVTLQCMQTCLPCVKSFCLTELYWDDDYRRIVLCAQIVRTCMNPVKKPPVLYFVWDDVRCYFRATHKHQIHYLTLDQVLSAVQKTVV